MSQLLSRKHIVLVVGCAFLQACGGGGGGGNDQPPGFSTAIIQSVAPGEIYSAHLVAQDSEDNAYGGSIAITNRSSELRGGVVVYPRELLIRMVSGTAISESASIAYRDSVGVLQVSTVPVTGLECAPELADSLPDFVESGDTGVLSKENCSDGTTREVSWHALASGNSLMNISYSVLSKDASDALVSEVETVLTINRSGSILGYEGRFKSNISGYELAYLGI